MRRTRVLVISASRGPTFHLVARAPFTALEAGGFCEVRFLRPKEPAVLKELLWCDVVFMVRAMNRASVMIARAARALGRPVIAYWDDLIFEVPRVDPDVPTFYEVPVVRDSARCTIQLADLLAVANPRLIPALQRHCHTLPPAVTLKVPALGVGLSQGPPRRMDSPVPVIGYAGNMQHGVQLQEFVVPALERLMQQGIHFRLEVAGPRLVLSEDLAAVTRFYDQMDYDAWIEYRNRLAWSIALAPVPGTEFYACKFRNKFVEYTAAGIPCIYSNVPPYTEAIEHGVTGFLSDNTVPAWADAIATLLSDAGLRATIRDAAWRKLATDHAMPVVIESYRSALDLCSRVGKLNAR